MTTNIYILKLENDKWYIGKSDNPQQRYLCHLNGAGSAWTSRHKPIELFKVFENLSPFDEDKYTKEYMSLYGIDNVRGGTYVTIELSQSQKNFIQKELWSMNNLCNNCGAADHWVANCPTRTVCSRCRRNSHTFEKCFAKTDLSGNVLAEATVPEVAVVPEEKPVSFFSKVSNQFINKISKINNEFTNKDSDLRSGRFIKKLFRM
jgi:hypothetical protein